MILLLRPCLTAINCRTQSQAQLCPGNLKSGYAMGKKLDLNFRQNIVKCLWQEARNTARTFWSSIKVRYFAEATTNKFVLRVVYSFCQEGKKMINIEHFFTNSRKSTIWIFSNIWLCPTVLLPAVQDYNFDFRCTLANPGNAKTEQLGGVEGT